LKGLGTHIVSAAEAFIISKGYKDAVLGTDESTKDFFIKHGYERGPGLAAQKTS
jgi:hypothetical protein